MENRAILLKENSEYGEPIQPKSFVSFAPYRINPLAIIEILEIERKIHIPKTISNIESNSWKSKLQKVYPIETSNHPLWLSLKSDDVVGLILPYPELDNDQLVDFKNLQNLKFLHLFNLGNAEQTISGDVERASFKNVTIPSNKRIVVVKIRFNDIH